jgi:hypothetical protein
MFSLTNEKAKLVNLNPRSELHGTDHKLAVDLSLEITQSNDVLSEFHPALKSFLYDKGDAAQQELIKDAAHLPALRFSNLKMPIGWNAELKGYLVTVHYGIGGKSDVVLADCEVDNFKFDCKEGGSVTLKFRAIAHPTPEQVGIQAGLIQQEIDMSLQPPEEQQQELQKAA